MRRFILYFLGLNLLALGIVLNISSKLGVAALSSSIYATSVIFELSFGIASILWYLLFVLIQCILEKAVKKEFLFEIPLSFVFGYLCDFYDWMIDISPENYVHSVLILIVAVTCISFGVFLTTKTDLVLNPGDGIVKTVSKVSRKPFHFIKNCFDISMIAASLALSFITGNPVMGIGVGTVVSAICIGRLIKLWEKLLGEKLKKFIDNGNCARKADGKDIGIRNLT